MDGDGTGDACEVFELIAPEEGATVFADSAPATFTWGRGHLSESRLLWGRDAGFTGARRRSGEGWLTQESYTPEEGLWRSILRLGSREGGVYWKVEGRDASRVEEDSPVRWLQLAAAAPAPVTAPPDGSQFSAAGPPPTLAWAANHNSRYRVVFSTREDLGGDHRVVSGRGYTLEGTAWEIPAKLWSKIALGLAPKGDGGRVYYALQSLDALGRKTQGTVRSLQVVVEQEH
jgi:hypothetical protein